MENLSTDNFMISMLDKWKDGMENHTSEFDKRVVVKEAYRVFIKDGVDNKGKDTYHFTWNGVVFDPIDDSVVIKARIITTGQRGMEELTTERLEAIISAAFSGIYCTPYDARNLYQAFGQKYTCRCDECGEFFGENLDKFEEHLRVTKHQDGIFEKYPHWKI